MSKRPSTETPPTIPSQSPDPPRSVRIGEVRIIAVDRHLMDSSDEHEKARIWWTKEEKREIIDRNHLLTHNFLLHNQSHVEQATALFERICSEDVLLDTGRCSDSDSSSDEDDRNSQKTSLEEDLVGEMTSKSILDIPTHMRGLEGGIVPASKAHRRTHVRKVLQWQETLSQSSPPSDGGNDDDRMALLLGQHAMTSSRRSRLMARILAESDHVSATTDPSCYARPDHRHNGLRRNRPRMIPSWW